MPNSIDSKFIDFINDHHVMTLATSHEKQAWCCNCFYIYLPEENLLIFTSDEETRHAKGIKANELVAASIVLETKTVGKIQGLQITGKAFLLEGLIQKKAKKAYLKAFPMAALMKTKLWALNIDYMKLTDNRLGFGKKLIWKKD